VDGAVGGAQVSGKRRQAGILAVHNVFSKIGDHAFGELNQLIQSFCFAPAVLVAFAFPRGCLIFGTAPFRAGAPRAPLRYRLWVPKDPTLGQGSMDRARTQFESIGPSDSPKLDKARPKVLEIVPRLRQRCLLLVEGREIVLPHCAIGKHQFEHAISQGRDFDDFNHCRLPVFAPTAEEHTPVPSFEAVLPGGRDTIL